MSEEDVLIVGAGPSSLILANELLRRGLKCRMIDRRTKPIEQSRAFTIHSKTMEMFENIGIAHRFLEYGIKNKGFTFNFQGQTHRTELDFTHTNTRYPYITVFNQNETEKLLREHLDSTYGARVEFGTTLNSLEEKDGEVAVNLTYIGREGEPGLERYPWVVGCDGIRSTVRQALGLPFEGESYGGQLMQMMDTEIDGFDHSDDWVHYFISEEAFLLVTKLPGKCYRILVSDRGESKARGELTTRDTFQEVFDKLGIKGEIKEPLESNMWRIWKRQTQSYRKGNIFVAGDAAHIHSPSGGQGMNACMQDTFSLGWKLAMVIKGQMKEGFLDSYEAERVPVATQVIDGTNDMHKIIMAHGEDLDGRMELTRRSGWNERAVAKISGLGYTYEAQYELPEDMTILPGPAIGSRSFDIVLHDKQRLFQITGHSRMSLVVLKRDGDEAASESLIDRISERYGDAIKGFIVQSGSTFGQNLDIYFQDERGDFFAQYGDPEKSVILLFRPDGYIGFRCLLSERQFLLQNLESFLIDNSAESFA